MRRRNRLAALLAGALASSSVVLAAAAPAQAAAPTTILNAGAQNSGNAQWMETQSTPDGGGGRRYVVTFLVEHAPGVVITGVRTDTDWDGADETSSATLRAVTAQQYGGAANLLETSRVTLSFDPGTPGGFGCSLFGNTTRRRDVPIRFRVQDSTGGQSQSVSTNLHVVEDSQGSGCADFPRVTGSSQSQTEVTPGQNITYNFTCDDVDTDFFSSDDDCDRARIRWRRLDDGTVSSVTERTGLNDNSNVAHTMSFPSQGYYVVEAQLGNENGNYPDTGGPSQGWWRIGNASVNDSAASLSGSLSFPGASASSPPSVNAGDPISALATVADDGGTVQVIEWDANNDGVFERRAYTVPDVESGNIDHDPVSGSQILQSVNTSSHGLRTVVARITDNGALDAADNSRRQLTFSGQLRVNAIPTAAHLTRSTNEDTPLSISLAGNDSDNQPEPLVYEIVSPPPASQGSLGAVVGNSVTFTPALNYFGPASFTYRVRDGGPSTVAAHAESNVATVSITVVSVNDLPTVDPRSVTTPEDTPIVVQVTGNDVEDGSNLTYTHASPVPPVGSVSCTAAGACTYTPAPDFHGSDSFLVRGTDSHGASGTATVSVQVTAVNDAPVAFDDTVAVPEDSANFPMTLAATDVDSVNLTFTAPLSDVSHGTLACAGNACTYTPDADYVGPDSFTFRVSDGQLTDVGVVTIDVTQVNDLPVATDVEAETDEDIPLLLTLGGTDVDGDPVTIHSVEVGAHGSVAIDGPNAVTYTPDPNFFGTDAFSFVVTDGNGGFDTGTAMITVHPVNDAPVVDDQAFEVPEDSATLLSMFATDVDGDSLTWKVVTAPGDGQLFGSGPDVAYVPHMNFHGIDTFVVEVDDGSGGVDRAVITIVVTPVNDRPVADAAVVSTSEDVDAEVVLVASDVDGDVLTFAAPVDGPFDGSVDCSQEVCTYTPDPDFNGADLFTFLVDDGNGGTDSASVTVIVEPVNDPPVAFAQHVTTAEDTATGISLAGTDVDGDALTFTTTAPANGTLSGVAPNLVYQPNPNQFGLDSFGFSVSDGAETASATVTIDVAAVNDAPVATGGTATTAEDTLVGFQLGGTDIEGDALSFAVTSPPDTGVLECGVGGACTYDPAPDFNGHESLIYAVSDGQDSGTGVFTIVVASENDPPEAENSSAVTDEDLPVTIDLVATDRDGDPLTYTIVAGPSHGTLSCAASGDSCVYTPAANYSGADSFVWSADDGSMGVVTATVTIAVAPVNDAPEALDVAAATDEEAPVTFDLLAVDHDGDPVTFSIESEPAHGTVTVAGGQATYTPDVDFNGVDSFTFRATDPSGASSVARATVSVTGLPLIPTQLLTEAAIARVNVVLSQGGLATALVALQGLQARLLAADGTPLPGRVVSFSIGGQLVCAASTDAQGLATCSAGVYGLALLLNLGYQASFAGDADHHGTSAPGPLLQILSIRI